MLNFFRRIPLRVAYALSLLRVGIHPGIKARRSKIRLGTLLLSLSVLASCNTKSTESNENSDSIVPDTNHVFSCYDTIAPPPRDSNTPSQKPANLRKTSGKRDKKMNIKEELAKDSIDAVPATLCYLPVINTNDEE